MSASAGDTATRVTAAQFVDALSAHGSPDWQQALQRAFAHGDDVVCSGVPMKQIFTLAKEFVAMPLGEVERLLDSPVHGVRVGAVSIMDWQARSRKTDAARRRALYELYLRRHDRINNWDLVDRAAPYVVGGYLFAKPRRALYALARSQSVWERRTAIVSTYYFIRQGDVADTFRIAEILLRDEHRLIHTAVGGWLREAGKKARPRLLQFLEAHAGDMPRVTLRFAIEHLTKKQRAHYMRIRKTV
jgi:DNA alkylation repair enzyme